MSTKVEVTTINPENPKKIPTMIFLVKKCLKNLKEKVEEFVLKHTAEKIMESLQEAYNKYKYLEAHISRSKETMNQKVPEIEKALEIIEFLEKPKGFYCNNFIEEDITVDYLITDTIYTKGIVPKSIQTVNLWLGANTMVEFSFAEAKNLLTKNLDNAKSNLKSFEEDLMFLKDQITTCEVNIARVYNQNLKLIQEGKVKPPTTET